MLGELFEKLIKDATFHQVAHFTLRRQHNVPSCPELQKYQTLYGNHLQELIFVMSDDRGETKLSTSLTQLATKQISPSQGPHLKKKEVRCQWRINFMSSLHVHTRAFIKSPWQGTDCLLRRTHTLSRHCGQARPVRNIKNVMKKGSPF